MTLQSLIATGEMRAHAVDVESIGKLLRAAHRNLLDAHPPALSNDVRFNGAWRCIRQCVRLGLWAAGYETTSDEPIAAHVGLASLRFTLSLPREDAQILDRLRRQGERADYEGDTISDLMLAECIAAATRLLGRTVTSLRDQGIAASAGE